MREQNEGLFCTGHGAEQSLSEGHSRHSKHCQRQNCLEVQKEDGCQGYSEPSLILTVSPNDSWTVTADLCNGLLLSWVALQGVCTKPKTTCSSEGRFKLLKDKAIPLWLFCLSFQSHLGWHCLAPCHSGSVLHCKMEMWQKNWIKCMHWLSTLDHKLAFPSLLYYTVFLVLTKCILAVSNEGSL